MAEREGTFFYERALAPPTVDQIIKMMIVYELHGLSDVAVDTAVKFFKELKKRFDGGAVGVAQRSGAPCFAHRPSPCAAIP